MRRNKREQSGEKDTEKSAKRPNIDDEKGAIVNTVKTTAQKLLPTMSSSAKKDATALRADKFRAREDQRVETHAKKMEAQKNRVETTTKKATGANALEIAKRNKSTECQSLETLARGKKQGVGVAEEIESEEDAEVKKEKEKFTHGVGPKTIYEPPERQPAEKKKTGPVRVSASAHGSIHAWDGPFAGLLATFTMTHWAPGEVAAQDKGPGMVESSRIPAGLPCPRLLRLASRRPGQLFSRPHPTIAGRVEWKGPSEWTSWMHEEFARILFWKMGQNAWFIVTDWRVSRYNPPALRDALTSPKKEMRDRGTSKSRRHQNRHLTTLSSDT